MLAGVLIVLLCAAGGVVLYRLGNNTGIADFKANQPFISASEMDDSKPEEIAIKLVEKWLNKFKTSEVSWASRLEDYRISSVDVARIKDGLVASAIFSVRPTRWSFNSWQSGAGVVEDSWIRNKSTRFTITRMGDGYQLQELGPGPL
jgi:hypothetical protein